VTELAWPDPPLADGAVRLRPWGEGGADDAVALAAAWADPEVQRWAAVPPPARRSVEHAARWIAHEAGRRRDGRALDLVISPVAPPDDLSVLGEVGLAPIDWEVMTAYIGWWVAAPARGSGVAARAVRLLAEWARSEHGHYVQAEVDTDNLASLRVAERAGVEVIGPPAPRTPRSL
jgi:RimJ/RimL family protein N-acetyltransferase